MRFMETVPRLVSMADHIKLNKLEEEEERTLKKSIMFINRKPTSARSKNYV